MIMILVILTPNSNIARQANVAEALELGCTTLLIDEDTCAHNDDSTNNDNNTDNNNTHNSKHTNNHNDHNTNNHNDHSNNNDNNHDNIIIDANKHPSGNINTRRDYLSNAGFLQKRRITWQIVAILDATKHA